MVCRGVTILHNDSSNRIRYFEEKTLYGSLVNYYC